MASRRIYGSYVRSMFLRPSSLRLLCPTPFLRHIITANSSSGNSCVVLHRGRVKPAHRCHNADERSEQWRHLTSDARPREPSESAAAAGERGLRILRESFESLEQDDAMEAWRCLLRAACDDDDGTETVPSTVYFALGNLHYIWGDLLEKGRKAELGAEGAARAVVAEVKELRRQALRKRAAGKTTRRAPANTTSGRENRGTDNAVVTRSSVNGGGSAGDRSREEVQLITSKANHREAWEWYLKAAENGDSRAMMQLGEIAMESASKSKINAQLAQEWYRRSASGDPPQADALFQLARMYHEGIGVHPDPDRARKLYEDACEAGSSAAIFFYGHCLHIGDEELGVATDCARALSLLTRASEQGHAEAMYYLAQAFRSGSPEMGISQDLRRFGEMVQKAATAGSADAMFALGGVFFHGEDGFANDPRAAFRYYSAAAGQGHADASYCLGVMHYAMGDLEAAFHCYQTAAEGGNKLAWRNLASMYALGEGVAQSEQMAKQILVTLGDTIERQEDGQGEPTGQKKPGEA